LDRGRGIAFFLVLLAIFYPQYLGGFVAGGSDSGDLIVLESRACYADYLLQPIYVYAENGSTYYASFLKVGTPASLRIYSVGSLGGEYVALNASLRVEPLAGLDYVDVVEARAEESVVDGVRIVNATGLVRVPYGSLGVAVDNVIVEGNVTIYARRVNSSFFEVTVAVSGMEAYYSVPREGLARVTLSSPWGLLGEGSVESLRVSFLVDVEGETVYLVGDGELVPVGERLPLFVYPENFDPRIFMEEVYRNAVEWARRAAEDPAELVLLAEKVERARNIGEKIDIIGDYTDRVLREEVSPRFTYLGSTCRASLGFEGLKWVCDLEINFSSPPSVLVIGDPLPYYVETGSIREALEKSIHVGSPGEGAAEPIRGSLVEAVGFKSSRILSLVLPLPGGNAFNASLVGVFGGLKVYECSELLEGLNRLGIRGDWREILESYRMELYEESGERIVRVYDKLTGELVAEMPVGVLEGTDAIVFAGDRYVASLQEKAEEAWRLWWPTVSQYWLDVRNAIYEAINDAVSRGGMLDLDKTLERLEEVWANYSSMVEPVITIPRETTTETPEEAIEGVDAQEDGIAREETGGVMARELATALIALIAASGIAFYVYKSRRG